MCFHLGQQLGWEYYGRVGTVFFLGERGGGRGGFSTTDKQVEDWFILLTLEHLPFSAFKIF